MRSKDKGGADAGQGVQQVTVHDYDPVRSAPPKNRKPPKSEAADRVLATHQIDDDADEDGE